MDPHRQEIRRLSQFGLCFVGVTGLSYLVPQAADLRPWIPGEPLPVLHILMDDKVVAETPSGELVEVSTAEATPAVAEPQLALAGVAAAPAPPEEPARISATGLPAHPPASPVAMVVPKGALDRYFSALAAAEDGEPGRIVRALHWGDSTIAADGIASSVRDRLIARFGDGGPGFLAIAVDPQWSLRPGISRVTEGEWQSFNITFGGVDTSRYGLAGVVSTSATLASATISGHKAEKGRQPLARADVYYQVQPGGGTLTVKPRGAGGATIATSGEKTSDKYKDLKLGGATSLWIQTGGDGPVTIYGAALETAGPGATWETFGVAGSSIGSLTRQGKAHLAGQVARRNPDLVVYMTGGNEVGYPSLSADEGKGYADAYRIALAKLRAGAPEASCLVLGPLDQATRTRGEIVSKPMLTRMISIQQTVATEAGCAFWDSRASMGGEGGFKRFLEHQPKYAWSDLMHLTLEGQDLIGQSLADALLGSYDAWRAAHPEAGWRPPVEATPAAPTAAPPAPAAAGKSG